MPQFQTPIPLAIQLYDGGNGYFPTATLYDSSSNLIAVVNLTEVENGFYNNYSVSMPDMPFVTAIYEVYNDSGHTSPAIQYQIANETFYLIPTPVSPVAIFATTSLIGVVDAVPCSNQTCNPTPIQDTITPGEDRTLTFRFIRADNQEPFDLTGFSEISFTFINADGTYLVLSYTDLSIPINIISLQAGKLTLNLTSEQTELLQANTPQPFYCTITIGTNVSICQFNTQVAIVPTPI